MKKWGFIPLVVTLMMTLSPVQEAGAAGFKDVVLYQNEINYLVSRNIIKGYDDGTFRPDRPVTRLQAVTMILREKGLDDAENLQASNPGFTDVDENTAGYGYIAKAADLQIIKGKPDGRFDPNGTLTRSQLAIILRNAYELKGTSSTSFSDMPTDVNTKEAILALIANGVTTGYGDGTFKPNGKMTRQHFALFLARAINPDFKTKGPNTPPQGEVYPDGWVAPVLKSSWTNNHEKNLQVFAKELGFDSNGVTYSVLQQPGAITVLGYRSNYEVTLKFSMWKSKHIQQSYRIPIVSKELFKFYFGKDYMTVWNYMDSGQIPDTFTVNGRTVKSMFSDADGCLYMDIGYPDKPF